MRTTLLTLGLLALTSLIPSATPTDPGDGNPLAALEALLGIWGIPDEVIAQRPELAERIVHDYAWTVGENALRVREGYLAGEADSADLEGILYWHPEAERLEFTAVAGHGLDQGRLFRGVYRVLADGRIERDYEVFYRNAADTPGEELGGLSRRYREVYTIDGDSLSATLDWWRDGAWQPFGPGGYALVRRF